MGKKQYDGMSSEAVIRAKEKDFAECNQRARDQHLTYGQLYAKEHPVEIVRKW